jgi:hypothetical protein
VKGALITRRRVVVAGIGLGSAVALGVIAMPPPPARGMRVLGSEEVRVVAALGEALFPEGNAVGPSWEDIDLVAEVDRILDRVLSDQAVLAFRYLLTALDWSAVLVAGKPVTACRIDERLELCRALDQRESVVRRAAKDGLRGVFALAYFDHPRVWAAIGYRSRCTGEPALPEVEGGP